MGKSKAYGLGRDARTGQLTNDSHVCTQDPIDGLCDCECHLD